MLRQFQKESIQTLVALAKLGMMIRGALNKKLADGFKIYNPRKSVG